VGRHFSIKPASVTKLSQRKSRKSIVLLTRVCKSGAVTNQAAEERNMKPLFITTAAILITAFGLSGKANGAARTWNNTGTDFNTAGDWTGGVPGSNDVGLFATAQTMQPNLSVSLTIAGLRFSDLTSGYDITNSGGAVLTLNGVNTTGSGGTTTASASAIRNDNVTGTTTIDAPLNLAPSTFISTIFQEAADGGTLILNGAIGQTGNVALSLKNGTIQLNGNNSYSGGSSIDAAGTTVVVGNNNGLGTGTFTNSATSTLQAGGGARTLANTTVLAGNMTISGNNAVTFNGSFTSSGSSSRTLTVSNTGGATLAGNVFLSEDNATVGRVFIVNGSSATTISGVVTNNNVGNTIAAGLRYSGTATLTLNNANTYAGGTSITVAGGNLIANTDGALGTGNVNLTAASVTLTLQNGAVNNYISDGASISIVTGGVTVLNFTGASDVVGGISLGGVTQTTPGTYGAIGSGADFESVFFNGTGMLTLIPEPSTYAMMLVGAGLLLGMLRLRRKTS